MGQAGPAKIALLAALVVLGPLAWAGQESPRLAGDVVSIHQADFVGNRRVVVGGTYLDFTSPMFGGGTVRLSDLVGPKVVLLQFWGIRCAPCLEEMKFLNRLQDEYGPSGLQVLGVNVDKMSPNLIAAAMEGRNAAAHYPVALDPEMQVAKNYTRWLVPVTVLIDRQGIVAAMHTGYRPDLDAIITAEVKQVLWRPYDP